MPRSRIDRRTFIALVVAGCADTTTRIPPVTPPATPVPTPPVVTPPPSTPPAEPSLSFGTWLNGYRDKALAAGIPAEVVQRELAGLTPNQNVVAQDTKQPEFSKPVSDYIKNTVSDVRVAQGRQFYTSLGFLPAIEQRYGVPREVVLAVWAMESAFGKIQGDMDVVRSLATLAWEGRRRQWAEDELTSALRIIARGEASRSQLRGSWAGAMGQTQFLPGVYLSTAIDADGDGRRDIWGSTHDALASTANYLAKAGWIAGQGWAREVTLPGGFDYSVTEGPKHPISWWEARGVRTADGRAWRPAEREAPAQLALPSGAGGPAFLLLPNHFAIRKYNNSMSYALGIGLLADRFAGEAGLVKAWPYEVPLSLVARQQAQRNLTKLGFDTGPADGVIGANTRAALRAWQQSRGVPADGYLSTAIIQRLQAEAAARP